MTCSKSHNKGSTVGRSTPEKKRKEGVILKDLDIKEMDRKLYLPKSLKAKFIRQLQKDTEVSFYSADCSPAVFRKAQSHGLQPVTGCLLRDANKQNKGSSKQG